MTTYDARSRPENLEGRLRKRACVYAELRCGDAREVDVGRGAGRPLTHDIFSSTKSEKAGCPKKESAHPTLGPQQEPSCLPRVRCSKALRGGFRGRLKSCPLHESQGTL